MHNGVAIECCVCELRFEAADEVYFEKYAKAFEAMVESTRMQLYVGVRADPLL
jgi:hypothetical protein